MYHKILDKDIQVPPLYQWIHVDQNPMNQHLCHMSLCQWNLITSMPYMHCPMMDPRFRDCIRVCMMQCDIIP